jgi:hypothetical protein
MPASLSEGEEALRSDVDVKVGCFDSAHFDG